MAPKFAGWKKYWVGDTSSRGNRETSTIFKSKAYLILKKSKARTIWKEYNQVSGEPVNSLEYYFEQGKIESLSYTTVSVWKKPK